MQLLGADRRFLFLQGPHGPFFHGLGRMLRAAGAQVWRVGFNRGDRAFWPEAESFIAYRGTPEDWPEAFRRLIAEKSITDLVLYGDTRPCQCPLNRLLDAKALDQLCVDACRRHGLTVVGQLFHTFQNAEGEAAGVTGTVVLAESHLAIHTRPEILSVTLDVYVCNFSGDNSRRAETLFEEVIAVFLPGEIEKSAVRRGQLGSGSKGRNDHRP